LEIDRELVDRIAREVVARLGGMAGAAAAQGAPAVSSGAGLLVVLTCSPVAVDEAAAQIRAARGRFGSVTAYLTKCGEGSAGEEIARRAGVDRVLRCSEGVSAEQALASVSAVAYPNCTMTGAARIGLLITDGPSAQIAIEALLRRVPVVIATNSLLASVGKGGYVPPEFAAVGQEHIARLGRLGVRTCDIRELASTLGAPASYASASAPVISGPAFPAPGFAPVPAYQPVAPSAAIACEPVLKNLEEFVASAMADDPSCLPCAAKLRSAIDQCIAAGACRIGTLGEPDRDAHSASGVAGMIDHTLLKANATPQEVEKLCAEAREYHFKSVCINPGYVALAKRLLKDSGVLVCTVIGFPLGATTTGTKSAETRDAVADGADEIDMVINIGALKAGEFEKVKHDIEAVVEAAKGRTVKVILETHFLTDEEKVAACHLSKAAGAHFVKTSTGFGGGGATAEDIALMRKVVGPGLGVKASGGVRTKEDAEKMIAAGANRIGASASIAIATGKKSESKGY
jgi:deoxyribose-phosphate aldolase